MSVSGGGQRGGRKVLASKTDAAVAAHHYSTFQGRRSSDGRTEIASFSGDIIEFIISALCSTFSSRLELCNTDKSYILKNH